MSCVSVRPTQIQNRVGEFSAFLLIEIANPQENLRDDVLVKPRLSWRWDRGIFPRHPTRGVGHAAVLFGKACAGQAINCGLDVFLFFSRDPWGTPKLAGLILVNFAHD